MMFLYIFCFMITICLGLPDTSYQSSDKQTVPVEPAWVTVLRSNLKQSVRQNGFKRAKSEIRDMIKEADEVVNHVKLNDEQMNPNLAMRMQPERQRRYVPEWERRLIALVRSLIKEYGKVSLDPVVGPVVEAIQREHNVVIHDLDVNSKGQVFVKYDYKNQGQPPQAQYGITGYET